MKRLRYRLVLLAILAAALVVGADTPPLFHSPRATAHFITVHGVRVRAAQAGHGSPTVVLVHGYGESLVGWRDVMDQLAPHFRVVALDVPPFGLSDKPRTGYSARQLADIVAGVIRASDSGGVALVGHSMGGEIAALVAIQHPELVKRLVLVDPAGLGGNVVAAMGPPGPVARRLASAWQGVMTAVLPTHDASWLAEPDSSLAYNPNADPAFYRAMNALLKEFDFTALEGRLSEVRAPTLLIWGRHDPLFPLDPVGRRFQKEIAGARLVVIDRAFHRPPSTRPQEVAREIVAFLQNSP